MSNFYFMRTGITSKLIVQVCLIVFPSLIWSQDTTKKILIPETNSLVTKQQITN